MPESLGRWVNDRMTILAREVLSDCERLLGELTPEMPATLWRPRWAGLVALLRAVGHVLDKVDGARSPEARQVIDEAWMEPRGCKPEPKIFWEFIDAERNNVLKAYTLSVSVNITVRPTNWRSFAPHSTRPTGLTIY